MAKHTFVVFTDPVKGRDDEYNAWYDNQHLADVLKVDGFVAAQRYRLSDTVEPQDATHRYLCLYEIETDDLEGTQKAMAEAREAGRVPVSEALDRPNLKAWYFEPIGARQPWSAPVLETFTDMQDLILLDPVHEVEPTRGWPASGEPAGG